MIATGLLSGPVFGQRLAMVLSQMSEPVRMVTGLRRRHSIARKSTSTWHFRQARISMTHPPTSSNSQPRVIFEG
jgi:hypothetical protein